jgi:hypothetical protein
MPRRAKDSLIGSLFSFVPNPFSTPAVFVGMKRPRQLLPGAFSPINLSQIQCEEEGRSRLLEEALYRIIGFISGLLLAALFVFGLYKYSTTPPHSAKHVAAGIFSKDH